VLFGPLDRQLGLFAVLQIWRDRFSVCPWPTQVARARWFLWSEDVGQEVGDLPFFLDFVDGKRRVLVQDIMGTSPGRRATTTCALPRAADLFIDSQSLVGDGAFLDLARVNCISGPNAINAPHFGPNSLKLHV
jgi:hypothetical protein